MSKVQNKSKLNKRNEEKLKSLCKVINNEIRKWYDTHRTNMIQGHLEKSRSDKKGQKELNK